MMLDTLVFWLRLIVAEAVAVERAVVALALRVELELDRWLHAVPA